MVGVVVAPLGQSYAPSLLVAPLPILLEAAIFFPEGFGSECAHSAECAECAFSCISVLITLRLTHAVISAENEARKKRGELQ